MHMPRLVISGLSGGAGKTMLSLGLARALAREGLRVRAFKKGPDYIDAAWLALAAHAPQANLDPFFTPGHSLRVLFARACAGYDLALVEGNRGLFDGLDIEGSCSTVAVSRIIQAPLALVLDCTKMTRTVAALVKGCMAFEEGLRIGGVILNRTGNARHQAMVRQAVEELCGVPVLGVLPRKADGLIAERHMGLAGTDECAHASERLDRIADFIAAHVDLAAVRRLAESAPELPAPAHDAPSGRAPQRSGFSPEAGGGRTAGKKRARSAAVAAPPKRPVIGYVRDAAFWFYYHENLEALRAAGACLQPVSLLDDRPWPALDGLYIGGGLPELHVEVLSGNKGKRALVASLSHAGLPIYAECGGFMYLADRLVVEGRSYPMAGVFSRSVEFCSEPQGLGYVTGEAVKDNPFHPWGLRFRGHEFHFSRCIPGHDTQQTHILRLDKGRGMGLNSDGSAGDGLLKNCTFASYVHIYAPALPHWAATFVALCLKRSCEQADIPALLYPQLL